MNQRRSAWHRGAALAFAALAAVQADATIAAAEQLPEIRLGPRNRVPACVTPPRMMRFLADRNPQMPAKFRNIAAFYKAHGERTGVRWDYAFFQMIVETNYLLFRNASGKGDVSPAQNNFAGIGTTGGGVPGDSFPDVSSGVLGQMQHLVAYSGERVDQPVARRTREKQDDIISASRRLGRPVTYRDLSGRWAADRRYWRSIAFIADTYRRRFCTGPQPPDPEEAAPAEVAAAVSAPPSSRRSAPTAAALPFVAASAVPVLPAAPKPAVRPRLACKVFTASYGGKRNVLIRRNVGNEIHYTAVQVLDGQEAGLAQAFIRDHAQGGELVGEYPSRDDALTGAFNLCPGGGLASGAGRG
ncbi:MAG: glucosaminidase domain-containing protein [Hyphomicrobiaceae bacterium]